jgi:polar amino acid transport system permease protein
MQQLPFDDDLGAPVPLRPWGRWIGATVLILFLAAVIYVFASSPNVKWSAIGQYLFSRPIMNGLLMTIRLTAICMAIGIVLGVCAGLMRVSANPVLKGASWLYVWFFRATPQLVQVIFWFNISLFVPQLYLGFAVVDTNTVVTSFVAATLALGLNQGAYMAEIVRSGIISVDPGQVSAATAIGMNRSQINRLIVLPQALKVILPPAGNEFISLLKSTSLVSAISARDLLNEAQSIYQQNFLVIELLIVASIWYMVLTSLASLGQYFLERYVSGGPVRASDLMARIVQNMAPLSRRMVAR